MSSVLSATACAPSTLPDTLPIFPLPGVVLLPRARLPLHIFEPRYLAMVDDVLATSSRMIGMIQPKADEPSGSADHPAVYSVGCAGRIMSFAETEDGHMMISLSGLCRFEIDQELEVQKPYRMVRAKWDKFGTDINLVPTVSIDHDRLSGVLKPYFKSQNIDADWATIESMADETLISTLAMICPLPPNEKQALLEAPDLAARADMLITLLEMSALPPGEGTARH